MAGKKRWSRDRKGRFFERLFRRVIRHVVGMTALTWRGVMDDTGRDAELHVFECVTELVGGAADGAEVVHGFGLRLDGLVGLLYREMDTRPEGELGVHFEAGFSCEIDGIAGDCPHVFVCGLFRGVPVVVYVYSKPPQDERPSWLCYQDGKMKPKEEEETTDE